MHDILTTFNQGVLVLGYVFLLLILIVFAHYFMWFLANKRYELRRKRQRDQELDDLEIQLLREERHYSDSDHSYSDGYSRFDTEILNYAVEEVYDYQKEFGP